MQQLLTDTATDRHEGFKAFVALNVEPFAAQWDQDQRIPDSVVSSLGTRGYLGCTVPQEYGGQGRDVATFGLLHEAVGRGSSALAGVLTVQSMVSMALLKWGTDAQRRRWLPPLARGEIIGAFAMTEPAGGSALHAMTTEFVQRSTTSDVLTLNGRKKWISCGQFADLFLVFGKWAGSPVACLVPRDSTGFHVRPIEDLMAFRAAGLAELYFDNVQVPSANIVGRPGFALSHVAPVGLHYGRLSTACSALGLLRGCVEESVDHASSRRIGDRLVGDIGMMRTLIARMGTDLEAARLLCAEACRAEDERRPDAYDRAWMAKYFTSRAVVRAASDAVQIRGASGCHASAPVSRFYRDAKVMEIIEGTTQIHEDLLGRIFVQRARRIAT
jgi:alkylation response protein AidB-like acyl-CoA dehydrogenase